MSRKSSPTNKPRTILGIDPGTGLIGFGVLRIDGSGFTCLEYGVIRNEGSDKIAGLINSERALTALIAKHRPDAASIERLFFANNQKTAMSVSEMRGVLLLTLAKHGLPVSEFTPLQVKQAVCNYGKADKEQVQKMVRMILKLPGKITPDDAADALAIAICGAAGPA